ncbi:MAG: transporter [Alteraurantiacibacter sp. bin_em_oilr2.035]|nr:transporter [Aurantiacibacter atlanticus]MDF1834215.1 transporter [Alteraurantiacibacter sp. bin_em_oilr2.035]
MEGEEVSQSETEFSVLTGVHYSSGDIDGQDYETKAASIGVAARNGRFSISASIPYVVTTAPEELIVSGGGLLGSSLFASPTSQTTQVEREGIGDLAIQAGYLLPVDAVDAFISTAVKVPTASSRTGLGTGEFDFGVSGELSKRLGSVVPFISAGYTIIGEPEGFDVRNTLSGSAGSQFLVGETSAITLSYSYNQSATDDIGDRQSVGIGFGTNLAPKLRLGVDGSAGLTEDAPDARVGLRLGIGF